MTNFNLILAINVYDFIKNIISDNTVPMPDKIFNILNDHSYIEILNITKDNSKLYKMKGSYIHGDYYLLINENVSQNISFRFNDNSYDAEGYIMITNKITPEILYDIISIIEMQEGNEDSIPIIVISAFKDNGIEITEKIKDNMGPELYNDISLLYVEAADTFNKGIELLAYMLISFEYE